VVGDVVGEVSDYYSRDGGHRLENSRIPAEPIVDESSAGVVSGIIRGLAWLRYQQ
jgi:hypothetical protein